MGKERQFLQLIYEGLRVCVGACVRVRVGAAVRVYVCVYVCMRVCACE